MQALHKDENEECFSRGANLVSIIIYAERISRYLEEEYDGEFEK